MWLIDNKLSLRLGKTESILFATNRKLKQHKFQRISCNGIKVGGKEVVTYLGGQLDQDLSGKSMAQKIIHTANASLKFLYWKKTFLNQPIAAHDFTIYLFDTHTSCYATFEESWCVEHVYSLWYTAQS